MSARPLALGFVVFGFVLAVGLSPLAVPGARAADLTGPEATALASELARAYLASIPVTAAPRDLSRDAAYAVQTRFVAALKETYGPPVGYKAGLTSAAAREHFGARGPISGVLLKGMLVKDGAVLPAGFGAVPVVEADLVVRVGSAAINDARTEDEALAALDAVFPFIELPDLLYAHGSGPDAGSLAASDVGARHGVLGRAIPLSPGIAWAERLGAFRVRLEDADGIPLAEGEGADLLGHPLKAVLWLRDDLKARGITLKPGDLLSLGTVGAPVRAFPGTYTATYTGLDPAGEVRVRVSLSE